MYYGNKNRITDDFYFTKFSNITKKEGKTIYGHILRHKNRRTRLRL